jgi:hypothetical protein
VSDDIQPFRIEASDDALDDLQRRLRATRWPEAEPVDDWSQGIPLAYLQEVCGYWSEKYEWRDRETRLNQSPQFKAMIDGLGIHFLQVRSPEASALPLLMTHGWPGSIVEFQKVIGPLSDPVAMLSTSSVRRFPVTASPTSLRVKAGASRRSAAPGRN